MQFGCNCDCLAPMGAPLSPQSAVDSGACVSDPDLPLQGHFQRAFAMVLLVSGGVGLVAGGWFYATDAVFDAVVRAWVLGAAAVGLGLFVHRTGRAGLAAHLMLAVLLLATLTSVWVRGTTSSMVPLLAAPCAIATTTRGIRAGAGWLLASAVVLAVAFFRSPGNAPALELALAVTATLAVLVTGGTTLAFRALTDQQRARVEATNASLREQELAAQAANRAKSTFLATMSHEIRTPLNAVLGHAELLGARDLSSDDLGRVREIRRAGSLLLDLLNDVLDLSRIESGEPTLAPRAVRLQPLLESVVHPLVAPAAERKVAVSLSVDAALPDRIVVDPLRLRQVVLNLVGNAIKFTPGGRVDVTATSDDGCLVLEVADTGVGIPVAWQAQVFERFKQADAGRDRAFGGSGLGLAIARGLVERMGGELELVRSAVGEGSTFALRLPLVTAASTPIEPSDSDAALPQGLRVLVVDDDRVNRSVVRAMLEHLGTTSEEAENGQEAVRRLLDGDAVDLVLMDQQMPVMDGLHATRRLRAAGLSVPIVALTANAFAEDREACLAAGMDAFLTKPVSRDALRGALAEVLSKKPPVASEARS